MASKGKVRVRGTCTSGHTTEGLSAPGRVTAELTCAHDGCGLPVRARRAPRDTPAATAPDALPEAPAADRKPYRVVEVASYDHDRRESRRKPEPEQQPAPGTGEPDVPPARAGVDPDPITEPRHRPEPARPRGKLTFRERVESRRRPERRTRRPDFLAGIMG